MINRSFAKASGLTIQPIKNPLQVEGCNHTILDQVDGRVQLQLRISHHKETITLWIMNLTDDADLLLGYDWLLHHSPQINWGKGTCNCENCPEPHVDLNRNMADLCLGRWDQELSKNDKLYVMDVQGYLKKQNSPWEIHRNGKQRTPQIILDYPKWYLKQYSDVFNEEDFDKLPPRRPWNHCIELSADFKPVNCKIYALT